MSSRPSGDVVRFGPKACVYPAAPSALREIRAFLAEIAGASDICGEDLDRILLVVNEVAANAIEHSDSGVVRIVWQDRDQGVQVTVEDDGVFDVHRRSAVERGRGLKIAIGLAGEVRIRAGRPDTPGTTVRLTIPVRARNSTGRDAASHGRPQVLVVDGDRFSGRALVSLLTAEGFDVVLAGSVDEARQALGATPPDLAIVDLMTSHGQAVALCAEIQRRSGTPVVALSAFQPQTLPSAVDRFIRRPAHPLEVLMVVRQLLAGAPAAVVRG